MIATLAVAWGARHRRSRQCGGLPAPDPAVVAHVEPVGAAPRQLEKRLAHGGVGHGAAACLVGPAARFSRSGREYECSPLVGAQIEPALRVAAEPLPVHVAEPLAAEPPEPARRAAQDAAGDG